MNNTEFRKGVISPVACVKEGFELIKSDYWLLFAITLVGGLIGGVTLYVLLGAMCCGIFYCYLRKIDGQPLSFDDLWKGFQWFGPSIIVVLAIVVPIIVLYGLLYAPLIVAAVMGSNLNQEEFMALLIGAVVIDLVFIVIMVCFHTLLMFAFPLIVDRSLGGFAAMMTSAKAVLKNLGGVAGLIAVNFGLTILGYLALCIGLYLVIPVIIAGNVVAYRRVFPNLNNAAGQNFRPPYTY